MNEILSSASGLLYTTSATGIVITGYRGTDPTLAIPDTIDGRPVIAIGAEAFLNDQTITDLQLPESVAEIGERAFKDCRRLTHAYLPVELTAIPDSCFENCESLEQIYLPFEVASIGQSAFKNCKKLSSLIHYPKMGTGGTMVVNRNHIDTDLPIQIQQIGEGAFAGCASLEAINIPHRITSVPASLLEGCTNLKHVLLHNNLTTIEPRAFAGCSSLKSLRLPRKTETVAADAFADSGTVLICDAKEVADKLAAIGASYQYLDVPAPVLSSAMTPFSHESEYACFYTEQDLEALRKKSEIRPAFPALSLQKGKISGEVSAYDRKDGIYFKKEETTSGRALIRMVGDLMCKNNAQKSALVLGEYNFDESFKHVAPLLQEGDLTIANMETMSSVSSPLSLQRSYANDRPYLNSPNEFLTSIKRAGVDVVINAQNHAYDTGYLGVMETLDALNRNQLMHTGLFAGEFDKRFLSVVVNGIHVAILSYCDRARQTMKQAYYSEYGLENLFSLYSKARLEADVKAARAEGAEFIIAYCHWGKEYTEAISSRQASFAKEVANAGVDYIFGSHPHCLQHYTVLTTEDGRQVPCLYSGGNFLSEMGVKPEMTRNTVVASLELVRSADGKVVIKEDGYFPCRIMQYKTVRGGFVVVPTNTKLVNAKRNDTLVEAEKAIAKTLGSAYKKLACRPGLEMSAPVQAAASAAVPAPVYDGEYGKYTLKKPMMVEIHNNVSQPAARYEKAENGIYEGIKNLQTKEATLLCAGQISYDASLGDRAKFGDYYNFRGNFHLVKKCFEKADLAVGNLTTMVCDRYLSSEMMSSKYNPNQGYRNARVEYLEALKYAGFDCLAMASPCNLDTGVDGIVRTAENITQAGMLPVGIGTEKNKIFNINDIRVGVLSYTLNCKNIQTMITAEGAELLLNKYSAARAKQDIAELKRQGAEFVLVYLNCGNQLGKVKLPERKTYGQELAEAGADYVICTVPQAVTEYFRHTTQDGRDVPVATSLGSFMTGNFNADSCLSALIRITLYKTADGSVEINDNYIPLKRFEALDGCNLPVVPAMKAFYPNYAVKDFSNVKTALAEKMGSAIKVAHDQIVKISEYGQPQLTFGEVYQLLGKTPSDEDLQKLDMEKKATCIAMRKAELKKGCVAVIVTHYGYKKPEFQITLNDAVKAGAALIIGEKKPKNIPFIAFPKGELKEVGAKLLQAIRDKYHPITVAITGTAGKTTTKELTSCVFDTHYKTLHVVGNYNQFYTCGTVLQKLTPAHEAYVQEVHGGTANSAKNVSLLIKPDIAMITNIGDGHLKDLGTIENVVKAKLEIVTGLKDTGVLIINDDNEHLHGLTMEGRRIIRYSTHDSSCDYYARNIENLGDKIRFQIVCAQGTYDAMLNMQGLHNVGNALAVFAAGIEAKIPPHKIIAGLTHYVPDADKQNLMHFNGYNMIVDTYSATPISVESAMETLSNFPVKPGTKKIAVLGDIPALGDSSEEKHIECGKRICKYDFDLMLCVGTDSRHFAIAAQEAGKEAYHYEDREAFNLKLAESIHPGDFILFKSGTRSHLKEETIYPLFGLIDKQ